MEEKREITREVRERVWEFIFMPHNRGVPLSSIGIEPGPYAYNMAGEMQVPLSDHWPRVDLTFRPDTNICDGVLLFAMAVCEAAGCQGKDDSITPKKVFKDGPVTGVIWADGKKTLTRRDEDDTDNANVALLNNYLRKETRNRGKYERSLGEAEMAALACADGCKPDEMRRAAKLLAFLADATEMMNGLDGDARG